jgi:hypothetical protein
MREEMVREALASLVEGRGVQAPAGDGLDPSKGLTDEERAELKSLILVADRLAERMQPVDPSPVFVRSLGAELVEEAGRQMVKRERRHRAAVISAAVAGAVVSIASVVGGVVMLIKWLRTRTDARQASTA